MYILYIYIYMHDLGPIFSWYGDCRSQTCPSENCLSCRAAALRKKFPVQTAGARGSLWHLVARWIQRFAMDQVSRFQAALISIS